MIFGFFELIALGILVLLGALVYVPLVYIRFSIEERKRQKIKRNFSRGVC